MFNILPQNHNLNKFWMKAVRIQSGNITSNFVSSYASSLFNTHNLFSLSNPVQPRKTWKQLEKLSKRSSTLKPQLVYCFGTSNNNKVGLNEKSSNGQPLHFPVNVFKYENVKSFKSVHFSAKSKIFWVLSLLRISLLLFDWLISFVWENAYQIWKLYSLLIGTRNWYHLVRIHVTQLAYLYKLCVVLKRKAVRHL